MTDYSDNPMTCLGCGELLDECLCNDDERCAICAGIGDECECWIPESEEDDGRKE